MLFVYASLLKKDFDFIDDEETKEQVGSIAFGIGILFGAMSAVLGLLAMVTACCNKKCCSCMVRSINYYLK